MAYSMEKVMETHAKRTDIQNIRRIFTYGRPADSPMETFWVNKFLFTPEMQEAGMYKDDFAYRGEEGEGNCIIRVGSPEESKTLFSCHTDTVHRSGIVQNVMINPDTMIFTTDSGQCLGADDGSGVWLMIELMRAGVKGLYIFHRAEEVGGQGSSWIVNNTPQLLEGMDRAVAFDRKDTWSIITHQACTRTCSDEFADDLGDKLGMGHRADSTGSFTDTANYDNIIPECTNLSVGYYNAHSARENQKIDYIREFRDALNQVDWESIVTDRNPEVSEYSSGGYYGYGTTLRKPPKKTREAMGWTDWNDYYYEGQVEKDKAKEVDDWEGWDDLDDDTGTKYSSKKKSIHELTEDEWTEMEMGDDDDGVQIVSDDDDEARFFNDWDEYEDWLDDEEVIEEEEEEDFNPDAKTDSEYDWDGWFKGFV